MRTAKDTKKSAFSCHQCRARKVKCGAESPACKRCVDRGDICVYKLLPTLSYTDRLEGRVRELEEEVRRLRCTSDGLMDSGPSQTPVPASNGVVEAASTPLGTGVTKRLDGLKLDEKGVITYHGPTSFFQDFTDRFAQEASNPKRFDSLKIMSEGSETRERLVSNAWEQRALETMSGIPEPFRFLLNLHWCWIQPLFNFIYRPAFSRDIEVMGPYYSHTLLNAVISHSIRWGRSDPATRERLEPYGHGELFGRQARSLVFDELNRGICTIPTVQTLLLLSASECSAGNSTQAWLYSGIAFRMIDHLGICIDGQRYASDVLLSEEDIEIRHRLFWSCYFWDKMISLYLGRTPYLQHSTVSPPQIMLDDSAESELWSPHGVHFLDGQHYPPTPAHSTSCFMQMCQLSVIFNQILIHMYDPLQQNTLPEMQACLSEQGLALNQWWSDLPSYLKLDTTNLPVFAPPSHIVTLNCLYHTFRILLFRPTLTRRSGESGPHQTRDPRHLIECVSSAVSIIAIFDLFCRSFGYSHCILSLSYSVYIAASIFLLQVEAGPHDEQTLHRLEFCIQSLERVKAINPVINNSLKPIYDKIGRLGLNTQPVQEELLAGVVSSGKKTTNFDETSVRLEVQDDYNMTPDLKYTGHLAQLDAAYFEEFEIPDDVLEAVSGLDPISVRIRPQE